MIDSLNQPLIDTAEKSQASVSDRSGEIYVGVNDSSDYNPINLLKPDDESPKSSARDDVAENDMELHLDSINFHTLCMNLHHIFPLLWHPHH